MQKLYQKLRVCFRLITACSSFDGHSASGQAFQKKDYPKISRVLYSDTSIKSGVVEFHFGTDNFIVPRGYLLGGSDSPRPNEPGFFTIEALLPELSPRTLDNNEKFGTLGFGDKIRITIHYKMRLPDSIETISLILSLHNQELSDYIDFDHDVKLYHMVKTPSHLDLYLKNQGGQLIFATCLTEDEGVPNKSCTVKENVSENFAVSYLFGKEHIVDWPLLDEKVRKLVFSFRMQ